MHEHRRDQVVEATFALIVTSDTRTPETDETGKKASEMLTEAGHRVAAYVIVPNEEEKIREAVKGFTRDPGIQAIITSGGTGIGLKDRTVDTVSGLLDKRLEGFGELFRHISYGEIGPVAVMSRATAGISGGKLIFCLPGSKAALELALEKIILPALGHMIWELRRN